MYSLKRIIFISLILILSACHSRNQMEGTWQLLTGTIVENGKTTVTDYSKDQSFIKVINGTHFTFLLHDTKDKTDSVKLFSAGGGRYELQGNKYTEHLEYCSDRTWEGHDFQFTIKFSGDTLIQTGIEKVDAIKRMNTEKYLRIKE